MKKKAQRTGTGFLGRREFLQAGATFMTAAAATTVAVKPKMANAAPELPESMFYPGEVDEPYGTPSVYEKDVVRLVWPQHEKTTLTASFTPLHLQKGIITPAGLHFGSHHSGVPEIDPESHELFIHGMTEKPIKLSVRDLQRYPVVGGIKFLECAGNTWAQGAFPEPAQQSCTELYGLLSGSEWLGVSVKTLLQEAGISPKAKWVIAEGADACSHARSIPLEKMMDDAFIALYQNGERLRPAQGYPMRLVLPGWEGNTNVKWLRRLEVTDRPAYTRDESRAYTETRADGSIEGFSMYMGTKSVITHPSAGQELTDKGFYEVSGLAWSGFGKIASVEVSDDGGANWYPANLDGPILDHALTRFSLPWQWDGKPVQLMSRAIDEHGNRQPSRDEWKAYYLPGSYNHYNAVQTWTIDQEGAITNAF